MQAGISHDRLLASIGVNELGQAKRAMRDYFQSTMSNPSARTLSGYMAMMDGRFKKPSEDIITHRMSQWGEFDKKNEDIRGFWLWFGRAMGHLRTHGIDRPGELSFNKAYRALDLSADQKVMIIAAIEMAGKGESLTDLKRLTVRILDVQTVSVDEEVFQQEDGRESDDNVEPKEEMDDINALQKPRAAKSKARPGHFDRSAQSSKGVFGFGWKNREDEMICMRCKQPGHWWRDCPLPFSKNIVFPKAKTSGKGGKSGRSKGTSKPGEKVVRIVYALQMMPRISRPRAIRRK